MTLGNLLKLVRFGLLLTVIGCGQGNQSNDSAEIRITFHDTLVEGGTISRIDMTVLETQIIDINDKKTTISSESHSFNLLEVTKNNPVVLSHTRIAPGTYKQIRLILDSNTTITLTDGTTHPLNVPSGEITGIKIDGVFDIPSGLLYTLDIDLDPGHSVHYAPGNGYMLKPVIELTGSHINSGNFFYAGTYGNDKFVIKVDVNNQMEAKTVRYPKYVIVGEYFYDSLNKKLTVSPEDVKCPSCSWWEKKKLKWFKDVPDTSVYNVLTFGADYIDLRDISTGRQMHLVRVSSFSFGYEMPTKDFTLRITGLDFALGGGATNDKILFGQLIPKERTGRGFAATDTISYGEDGYLKFSIPQDEFGIFLEKGYILTMGIVNDIADLTLSSDGTIIGVQNAVAHNLDNATWLKVSRDSVVLEPVKIPFMPVP